MPLHVRLLASPRLSCHHWLPAALPQLMSTGWTVRTSCSVQQAGQQLQQEQPTSRAALQPPVTAVAMHHPIEMILICRPRQPAGQLRHCSVPLSKLGHFCALCSCGVNHRPEHGCALPQHRASGPLALSLCNWLAICHWLQGCTLFVWGETSCRKHARVVRRRSPHMCVLVAYHDAQQSGDIWGACTAQVTSSAGCLSSLQQYGRSKRLCRQLDWEVLRQLP